MRFVTNAPIGDGALEYCGVGDKPSGDDRQLNPPVQGDVASTERVIQLGDAGLSQVIPQSAPVGPPARRREDSCRPRPARSAADRKLFGLLESSSSINR